MEKRDLNKQERMYIVGIWGCIAFILMVGEPIEEETWFRVFFITKGLAFLIGYVCYTLSCIGNPRVFCLIWTNKFNFNDTN